MFLGDRLQSVERLEEQFERELAELEQMFPKHKYHRKHHNPSAQKVKQVLITIFNNQKFIIMDPLSLQNGNQAPINEALVDAGTLLPIPGATKVNKSRTSDTPAVATVDANGNLVAVALGTGNLTCVNTWTYTDEDTNESVTADETTVTPFQVIATPEGVLQVVTLGAQTAIPAAPVAAAQS